MAAEGDSHHGVTKSCDNDDGGSVWKFERTWAWTFDTDELNDEEDIGRKKNIAFKTEVIKGKRQKEE